MLHRRTLLQASAAAAVGMPAGVESHQSSDRPVVALALGDGPGDLLAQSTYPFDFKQIKAIDLVSAIGAVRFRFTRDPGGFELPLAGLVILSFLGGRINSVRVNPHLGGLAEGAAIEVAASVHPRVEGAGFRRVPGLGKSIEVLPFELADRARPLDTTILVAKWMYGNDAILLELERSGSSNLERKPEPPSHLVRLRIENGPLTRRQSALVVGTGRDVVWKRA